MKLAMNLRVDIKTGRETVTESVARHYETEKLLADRLRQSTREERSRLYSQLYDELFKCVPWHQQLMPRNNREREAEIEWIIRLLQRYVKPDDTYLEIGVGDCLLLSRVARICRKVIGLDVSEEVTKNANIPSNARLLITNGIEIPVGADSVTFVFSNQLIEHLHPDDVRPHLCSVYESLHTGGAYMCATPHRYTGPHDISRYFDERATGFHLHEYTVAEIYELFMDAGFGKVSVVLYGKDIAINVPPNVILPFERLIGLLPYRNRKRLCRLPILKAVFQRLIIIAHKFA